MSFLAVVDLTDDDRIATFAEFPNRQDAIAHSNKFGGFVVNRAGRAIAHMKINPASKAVRLEVPVRTTTESVERQALRILSNTAGPGIKARIAALLDT